MNIIGVSMYGFKVKGISQSSILFDAGKAKVQELAVFFTSNDVTGYFSLSDTEANKLIKLLQTNLKYTRKKTNHGNKDTNIRR